MNFEDKISIQGAVYSDGYVKVGNAFYMIDDNGQPDTQRRYDFPLRKYDEDGNPVSVTDSFWIDFGKCIHIFLRSLSSFKQKKISIDTKRRRCG